MVRFGLIGTNKITEDFIKAASQIDAFSLTAVYSRTQERALEFAHQYGIAHTFTNLEAMATSHEIDAVYIASPNSYHAQQAVLCMNHGKHVLCEKPMASNAAELSRMVEAAKRNKVLLMEAMKPTLVPNFHVIRQNLHKIGPVRRSVIHYSQYSSRYDAFKAGAMPNAFNPIFSNGALMDIGVYGVYSTVLLFGKPKKVHANAFMLGSGVDGEGSILLKYDDMESVIMYSKITHSFLPCEIQGEKGNIIFDKVNVPGKVEILYRDGTKEDLTVPQEPHSMVYETREFVELINQGELESRVNSQTHSMIVMEIMDEVRKQIGLVYAADISLVEED
ncbi:Gfo/Idh/MocA family protein [Ammoniphilus sp. YIM 78166]|uniref:Gfo/Idh/MocA family protein n=1 Tax=Ammoniphilus sp. YIM 78166 TaxID=1644106 RepID=UPI00106F4B51|nr:Gfo/Idh/MocA family oxidoreductase [Ammoniphilus sp. YIM 78166]